MTLLMTATYSAEDNKLRLYASERLDLELYKLVKELGFKWAPKQELFVAPKWTPAREDLCIELVGTITAEQTTMVERAEAKAERLEGLADKRGREANCFFNAASSISERFAGGQPILIGHHSERKARKDQELMNSAMRAAVKANGAVEYWNYKAVGVQHHANRKANAAVRARRIKGLLAELRDRQRDINHAFICLDLWGRIESTEDALLKDKLTRQYSGAQLATGQAAPYYRGESLWSQLQNDSITSEEVINTCLDFHDYQSKNPHTIRWISHILNRLAFERSELGEVALFTGDLTPTIIKAFAREHGAYKPEVKKIEGRWVLSSAVALPFHLANAKELILDNAAWCALMQSSGYEVPAAIPKKPAILNFKCISIRGVSWGNVRVFDQIELTKAEYSAIYSDYRGVKVSECGHFRFKMCKDPKINSFSANWVAVYITDSKVHSMPESESISLEKAKEVSV